MQYVNYQDQQFLQQPALQGITDTAGDVIANVGGKTFDITKLVQKEVDKALKNSGKIWDVVEKQVTKAIKKFWDGVKSIVEDALDYIKGWARIIKIAAIIMIMIFILFAILIGILFWKVFTK